MRKLVLILLFIFMAHPAFAWHKVHVTAYAENPHHSASGKKLHKGTIAVSQDLYKKGYTFGKRVTLKGIGTFVIADLMPRQWSSRVDIWVPCVSDACLFGITMSTIEME